MLECYAAHLEVVAAHREVVAHRAAVHSVVLNVRGAYMGHGAQSLQLKFIMPSTKIQLFPPICIE